MAFVVRTSLSGAPCSVSIDIVDVTRRYLSFVSRAVTNYMNGREHPEGDSTMKSQNRKTADAADANTMNPLWVITIGMAVFFAVVAALVATG
ncbi:MAG: hypothetical protein ACT4O5_04440 [Gammaproteobacteria bacterium]